MELRPVLFQVVKKYIHFVICKISEMIYKVVIKRLGMGVFVAEGLLGRMGHLSLM